MESDVESLLLKCDQLEKALEGRDDYVDAITNSSTVDLTTVARGTIVKFDCSLHVPEKFTTTLLIDDFKRIIINEVDQNETDERGKEVMRDIINTAEISTIPVEIEVDNVLLCSKLYSKNMLISIQDLEDYEEEELTALVRVVNNGMHEQSKPYYDPMKDYLALNRAIRRSIKKIPEGMDKLYADSDYKPVEVVAIYQ